MAYAQTSTPETPRATFEFERLRFRRSRATRAWLAAVEEFEAAALAIWECEQPSNVVFLPAEVRRRESEYHRTAFALISHPDRRPEDERSFVRLEAALIGLPDPAWMTADQVRTRAEAVMLASYCAAGRRRA